jgi:Mce-associated membrane protein
VTDEVRDANGVAADTDSDAPEATAEADESATEAPSDQEEAEDADSSDLVERPRRRLAPMVRKIGSVVLALLFLISGGVATWLYFKQYRPDQQTDAEVARTVGRAASDGTVALLSYSSDTLDKDFAAARSHLGGEFLSYYEQFSQSTVAPVAKQKSMKTTAQVTGAAVSELHPDWAVVLVFVNQSTTTNNTPQPLLAASSVLVHMNRINDKWLITKFTPI